MVRCAREYEGGNQGQETELAAMWRMIEDFSQTCACFTVTGTCGKRIEILEGDHNPFDLPEGGPEGELDDGEDENPFHDAGTSDFLWHKADWKSGWHMHLICQVVEIKLEVSDFYGRMHAEDYLDWESSLGITLSGSLWSM